MGKHTLIGKKAPEVSLPNFDGAMFTFTPGASGWPTALFFYPQSGTYGCTKEACLFKDALSEDEIFKSSHIEVIGVSPDPVEKQKKFVEKHGLPYPILSDEKGEARKAYGVGKGLFGLTSSGRVTFVIDSEGTIKDVFESTLNFSAHHKFVEDWLKSSQPKEPSTTASAAAPAPASTEQPSGDKPAEGEQTATAT